MKKLMCVVALMLGMSTATFGNVNRVFVNDDTEALYINYNINANAKSLGRYLELSEDQEPLVIEFQRIFEKSLLSASGANTKSMRKAIVRNTIKSTLRNMNCILTKEQYRKYILVLNASLRNRGIVE